MTESMCPVCGGPTAVAFTATDRNRRISGDRFTYRRCTRCHTLRLTPVPQDLERYYPSEYYSVPRDRATLIAASGPERYKLDIVREFVPAGRVVEVGPAIGGFAAVMQDAGYDTSAIEMDARCCAFLRSTVGLPVQETDDPVTALRADAPFDVVAMWHVIEHLPNPREVLQAAAQSLAPGGIIVLAAPNPESLQFRLLGPRWTHLDAPRHLLLIPPAVLAGVGQSFGLEVALLTTSDRGTIAWNGFGWRESFAGFARDRYLKLALRLLGYLVTPVFARIERQGNRGSTYTLVLRRPDANGAAA